MSSHEIPPYKLINEGNQRDGLLKGIHINGWEISSRKAPILNWSEMDRASSRLQYPLPEMIFGNNKVSIKHEGENFSLFFDALDALDDVDKTGNSSEAVQVAYAKEWANTRSQGEDIKSIIKPYDWTYTTGYKGTLDSSISDNKFYSTNVPIDIEKLKRPDPILFYDENILYEDELADNGTAVLQVKIRVMPTSFFLLQRFFLRVDDVLFRMNDTRIWHEFGSTYLTREYSSREEHYSKIKSQLPPSNKAEDLSLLTDPNWVSAALPPPGKDGVLRERIQVTKEG